MDEQGRFLARILDAGLNALAAGTVVRQRELLREQGIALPPGFFEDMIGDTEVRILHLAEALATARPALFTEQVEWTRSSLMARGLSEERLALNLTCLRRELELELPAHVSGSALEILDIMGSAFERPPRAIHSLLECAGEHVDLIRRLLLALLEARRGDALDLVLGAADRGLSVSEIETQIIAPVQAEVGRMWQCGELHIHEEHLGSRIIEEALILLRGKMMATPKRDKTVLISSVRGNLHDIGTRIVADHFEMDGWNALRLGANLPDEDLALATLDFGADLVALSATMTTHVRDTAAAIAGLRARCGDQTPPVLVGGRPFQQADDLWQVVGADGWSPDAPGAVTVGSELLELDQR